MRKGLGLLFAISLCLPVGVLTASSAGSAVNTVVPKCKLFSGTQTYTPGLPPTSSSTLVKPLTKTVAALTGCTGGGITKGTANGSQKATVATNCKKLFADAAAHKPAPATVATVKWSNGQTSTTSSVLTVTGVSGNALKATLVSKTTAGLGKGHTTTIQVTATPNAGWCSSKPFTKVAFKSTKITYK
jgi:hypothetical protein